MTAAIAGAADTALDDLADDEYELAQRILDATATRTGRDFSPSEIARMPKVKADVTAVHRVLPALVADGHLSTTDRGAWSRYRFIWG